LRPDSAGVRNQAGIGPDVDKWTYGKAQTNEQQEVDEMTIQQAIKSGKPFRRKAWKYWWNRLDADLRPRASFTATERRKYSGYSCFRGPKIVVRDILATDWETKK
jgi:hypothetical protein